VPVGARRDVQEIMANVGFESTTDDVLAGQDLSGKTAVVTGGTSGVGWETARALASAGAHVVITARDATKADQAIGAFPHGALPGAVAGYKPQVRFRRHLRRLLRNQPVAPPQYSQIASNPTARR